LQWNSAHADEKDGAVLAAARLQWRVHRGPGSLHRAPPSMKPMKLRLGAIVACTLILAPTLSAANAPPVPGVLPASVPDRVVQPQNVTPVCLDRSDIPESELHWLRIPANASELATSEDYAYLSGQLIQNGVVDASDCPLGGFWPDGYATACGLARTRQVSLYLQNVYDDEILAAGKDIGVPPVLIKQLIRYESQFWPVQWGPYHYGLGHLTFPGAVTALFWNPALYAAAYAEAPGSVDLPASLVSLMNAYCPTCSYGLDIPKAERSIPLIAQVLLAYCKQTTQVIYNATKVSPGDVVDYATVWRLTLLNYNAGPNCAFDAVKANFKLGSKLSWVGIADKLAVRMCIRGVGYADTISAPYYEFRTRP